MESDYRRLWASYAIRFTANPCELDEITVCWLIVVIAMSIPVPFLLGLCYVINPDYNILLSSTRARQRTRVASVRWYLAKSPWTARECRWRSTSWMNQEGTVISRLTHSLSQITCGDADATIENEKTKPTRCIAAVRKEVWRDLSMKSDNIIVEKS